MKHCFSLILFLFFLSATSQEIVGHIITNKDKKINMYENAENKVKGRMYHILYGDMNLTGEYIRYYDENNELKKFSQSKVEKLVFGAKRYMTLPIKKRVKRVHEVIAENNEFLLTEYYSYGAFYFYIFNKNNSAPEIEKMQHSFFIENDAKIIEIIREYFPECTELLETMAENMENSDTKDEKTHLGIVKAYIPEKSDNGTIIPNRILSKGLINLECN